MACVQEVDYYIGLNLVQLMGVGTQTVCVHILHARESVCVYLMCVYVCVCVLACVDACAWMCVCVCVDHSG